MDTCYRYNSDITTGICDFCGMAGTSHTKKIGTVHIGTKAIEYMSEINGKTCTLTQLNITGSPDAICSECTIIKSLHVKDDNEETRKNLFMELRKRNHNLIRDARNGLVILFITDFFTMIYSIIWMLSTKEGINWTIIYGLIIANAVGGIAIFIRYKSKYLSINRTALYTLLLLFIVSVMVFILLLTRYQRTG